MKVGLQVVVDDIAESMKDIAQSTRFLILLIIQINLHPSKPTRLGFRVYTAEDFMHVSKDLTYYILVLFFEARWPTQETWMRRS